MMDFEGIARSVASHYQEKNPTTVSMAIAVSSVILEHSGNECAREKRYWSISLQSIMRLCLSFAALLVASLSSPLPLAAQSSNVDTLDKRLGELFRAGDYTGALPLAAQILT